jgi:hypothetical protein
MTLEVTGTGTASSITWGTKGGISQLSNVRLPWRKEISDEGGTYSFVTLGVATGATGGEATCRVTSPDGQVRTNSISGRLATVTCSSGP